MSPARGRCQPGRAGCAGCAGGPTCAASPGRPLADALAHDRRSEHDRPVSSAGHGGDGQHSPYLHLVRDETGRSPKRTNPASKPPPAPPAAMEDMERAVALRRFARLAEFYGAGRKLTATGNPTLADGRLLVGLLDLDDELDPSFGSRTSVTRSAGELHDLTFTIRWALRAGAVRKVHGRLAATATWSKAGTTEHFRRAAEALVSAGPLVLRHGIGYGTRHCTSWSTVPSLLCSSASVTDRSS